MELNGSSISLTNLVAYYRMENGALTTDSSGNSKTLTNNGTITGEAAGKYGYCADLGTSNTSKYFSRADGLGVDLSGAVTINFWIKLRTELASSELYDLIIWYSTTGTARYFYSYYQQIGGGTRLAVNNSEGYAQIDLPTRLGIDNWHMVTFVATGTVVSVYLDGEKVTSTTRGTTTTALNKLSIGALPVANQYADAYFDDVSFWSRALTDGEISALADQVPNGIIII